MPAEEMDIITDVSHSGPAEDIDLDLDDAVAHTDDDMELGDYNEKQGAIEVVDEMMAEGDDTSDGMVDADEIDYNVSGVADSDYDIDIGGTDGNLYEMDNVGQNVDISLGDEIEYAVDTEPTGPANEQTTNGDWLQDQNLAGVVAAEGDVNQMEDTPIEEGDQAPVSQEAQATIVTADLGEAAVLPGVTYTEVHGNEATNDEQQRNEPAEGQHVGLEDLAGDFDNEASHHEPAETGSGEYSKDQFDENKNTSSALPAGPDNQTENSVTLASATIGGVELAGDDSVDGAAGAVAVANAAEAINVSETAETLEASWVEPAGETAEAGEHYSTAESSEVAKNGEVSEVHASDDAEARAKSTHDFPVGNEKPYDFGAEGTHSHENPPGDHSNPAVGTVKEDVGVDADADANNHSQSSRLPHTQITASEHPSAIAARYEILIHYGKTDYQLFAKSVDDDPEQYFLSDRSALDTSLLEFLASIRDVISEEVSPLDELVMHIDGLGLEFGETTTRDFIERYTFGDMLALYDKLVKNEDADDTPELYVYLLVKPNCSQRLAALVDQANSGRKFSDVAVYRDSTPAQDDEVPHGEGRVLAISPDIAVDEFFDDFDEEDSTQEQEAVENPEQDDAENRQQEVAGDKEDAEYHEQEATEDHEQEAVEYDEQEATEDHEQETAEYDEQEATEYDEQETTEDHEQENAEYDAQEAVEYYEQEVAEYQEQEPFEFEMQEGVEQQEHNNFDEKAQHHEDGTNTQDYNGFSEHRAPADARDTLESAPSATAPVEMTQALEHNVDESTRAEDVDLSNYDDNEDGLDVGPSQEDHTDVIGLDSTATEGEGAATSDGQVVDASSHNTSATTTLNGDDNDEIDYSDGEAEVDPKPRDTIASATSQEQANDDFIWESEDEDTREETVVTPPKQSAQVSPTTGKRARSGSDAAEDADAHASVRRRLS